MLRVEEALEQILRATEPLGATEVDLLSSIGGFLAEDVCADIDLPPFDNSAVDGYAVRAEDVAGASPGSPALLREIGDVAAGRAAEVRVTAGTACRIMTGAPIPPGADAVVMIEDTRREAVAAGTAPVVAILEAAAAEQHVRRAGEELRAGTCVLQSSARIRAAEIAMLATVGRARVRVGRRPRVAVFSTGDELVDISAPGPPPPGKIRDSNRCTLAALVVEAGAQVHSIGRLPDDLDATERALRAVAGADVILTAGGVSMGDRDYVRPAVERLGTLALWKVAVKPGKPLAFGSVGGALFFGLPGNPVSAMVTFELFARPALRKLAGAAEGDLFRRTVRGTLTHDLPHTPGRREYVRARTEWRGDGYEATASGAQGSGMVHSATAANSLLIVPEESEGLKAGARADILLLD
jgi:molybdopterin molybdotransferase